MFESDRPRPRRPFPLSKILEYPVWWRGDAQFLDDNGIDYTSIPELREIGK